MKAIPVLVFAALCGIVWCKPQQTYTTKYDNVDLDSIIRNDRLLRSYIDCVLGKKKCTRDGEELKKHLPDAIQNDCAKCSEAQKNGSRKIIKHLAKNRREWWNELEARFDPSGIYKSLHAAEFQKEGIVL